MIAPGTYYNAAKQGIFANDGIELLTKGLVPVTKPTFLGACLKDYVCPASAMKASTEKSCINLIVKEYNAGHWVMLECRDAVNRDLGQWLESLSTE
jgi:soluble epoxide hydrolase / lipid-phosphate phosphatase